MVVLAETEEQALELACDAPSFGDFTLTNGGPAEEVIDVDDDEARGTYIRHADMVVDERGRQIKARDALARIAP